MRVYKVSFDIDVIGKKMKDQYFLSYKNAKGCVMNMNPICFYKDKWTIDGMKDCFVFEKDESFTLVGTPHSDEDKDEYCIDKCRVLIDPIDLDFNLSNNSLFILNYIKGYTDWLYNCDDETIQEPNIIGYFRTVKHARKIAGRKKSIRKTARAWIKKETEERISVCGHGENYLSIEKVIVQ